MMAKFHTWKASIVDRMKAPVSTLSQPPCFYLFTTSSFCFLLSVLHHVFYSSTLFSHFIHFAISLVEKLHVTASMTLSVSVSFSPDCSSFVGEHNAVLSVVFILSAVRTIVSSHPARCQQKTFSLWCSCTTFVSLSGRWGYDTCLINRTCWHKSKFTVLVCKLLTWPPIRFTQCYVPCEKQLTFCCSFHRSLPSVSHLLLTWVGSNIN